MTSFERQDHVESRVVSTRPPQRHAAALHRKSLIALLSTCSMLALTACSDTPNSTRQADAVYVCAETQQSFLGPTVGTPALNPSTGRRTLMPGLYCQHCLAWYASPPTEHLQRMPGGFACPKTHRPLTADGPAPEQAARLGDTGDEDP